MTVVCDNKVVVSAEAMGEAGKRSASPDEYSSDGGIVDGLARAPSRGIDRRNRPCSAFVLAIATDFGRRGESRIANA